jgi:hypothetical protein
VDDEARTAGAAFREAAEQVDGAESSNDAITSSIRSCGGCDPLPRRSLSQSDPLQEFICEAGDAKVGHFGRVAPRAPLPLDFKGDGATNDRADAAAFPRRNRLDGDMQVAGQPEGLVSKGV